ncbi:MAG: hypothetical protein A3C35_08460 [Omnitrophica bacterium RIFCSPHIGHO2_02_FULL_46_11]|nr:MAG: hypothetical protein A3C35_08460 [Omnitrophica bacterium RIFCSPHIGHO2_02_FULL_46_11]OGW87818.1 MAG: hypothetical protein A3A81_01865 [Omnitrophica bacterium RIFCSPLOWO2_01_FULL_45_10b]
MKEKESSKRPLILILDDEKEILEAFSYLMKELNCDTEFCPTPEEAIEVIRKEPDHYSLIVTDIKMPTMNGIEFAEKVRELNSEVPIIFMTGYPSDEVKRQTLRFKKVVYLEKPFHLVPTFGELIPKLLGTEAS